MRKSLTNSQQKTILGRQNHQCANRPSSIIKGLEDYSCPLWSKKEYPGNFDESGYDFDHIFELAFSNDNSIDNFQALCKSCHSTKTKRFISKHNKYHPVYGKHLFNNGESDFYLSDSLKIVEKSKIWSRNRKPDLKRVEKIKKYILEKNLVDGIIYLAELDEGLICYDGNHRREALKNIDKNFKVLVNILEKKETANLEEKFRNLNKCVPITDLVFSKGTTHNEIDKIKKVCDYFMEIWKDHRKASSRPRKPNFNQNTLEEKIVKIIEFYGQNIKKISLEKIKQYVNNYNMLLKNKAASFNLKDTIKEKCAKNNCYLFIE